jgi:hypothetical protein
VVVATLAVVVEATKEEEEESKEEEDESELAEGSITVVVTPWQEDRGRTNSKTSSGATAATAHSCTVHLQ